MSLKTELEEACNQITELKDIISDLNQEITELKLENERLASMIPQRTKPRQVYNPRA